MILLSDLGIVCFLTFLYKVSMATSFALVFQVYGIPYLITNLFLVLITFLQHTDHQLPHYTTKVYIYISIYQSIQSIPFCFIMALMLSSIHLWGLYIYIYIYQYIGVGLYI